LCDDDHVQPLAQVMSRQYMVCGRCHLSFLLRAHHPDTETERAHYLKHDNNPGDPQYRAFLDRLAQPLIKRLPAGATGLDYGSGPGPTLSVMLEERGFSVWLYDPFFAPDPAPLQERYDFITCTETVEHFFNPADEFARFDQLLRPGGWLGIMTQMRDEKYCFETWHYVLDPTHVCFYHKRTLCWIAQQYGWQLEIPAKNVALFHKPVRNHYNSVWR